jgi:hypothetical protein
MNPIQITMTSSSITTHLRRLLPHDEGVLRATPTNNSTHAANTIRDERIATKGAAASNTTMPLKVQIIQEFVIVLFFVIGALNIYGMRRQRQRHPDVRKHKNAQTSNKNKNENEIDADSSEEPDLSFLFEMGYHY